jgi:hypothetical protein
VAVEKALQAVAATTNTMLQTMHFTVVVKVLAVALVEAV